MVRPALKAYLGVGSGSEGTQREQEHRRELPGDHDECSRGDGDGGSERSGGAKRRGNSNVASDRALTSGRSFLLGNHSCRRPREAKRARLPLLDWRQPCTSCTRPRPCTIRAANATEPFTTVFALAAQQAADGWLPLCWIHHVQSTPPTVKRAPGGCSQCRTCLDHMCQILSSLPLTVLILADPHLRSSGSPLPPL